VNPSGEWYRFGDCFTSRGASFEFAFDVEPDTNNQVEYEHAVKGLWLL
jgi:hypothetical protein